jgi:type II secretory pathway component HofQ
LTVVRTAIAFIALATIALFPTRSLAGAALSLDVRDVDIYDAVRLLSTEGSTNVVVDSSVQHRPITLRLRDVSFDEALRTLAEANDLEAVRVGNVVYLGTSDVMNRRYSSRAARGVKTETFRVASADAADLAKSLADALPRGTVVIPDRRTSSIIVRNAHVPRAGRADRRDARRLVRPARRGASDALRQSE